MPMSSGSSTTRVSHNANLVLDVFVRAPVPGHQQQVRTADIRDCGDRR